MNLHIGVDNTFIDRVFLNLKELGLENNNRFIIRSKTKPEYVKQDVLFAPLYSSEFEKLIGDTEQYKRVIIHQFSPLMFRWVARHNFQTLDWAIWGADLYDLSFVNFDLHEPETLEKYIKKRKSINN